jgi:gliding motility-associated-like protein
MIRKIILLLLLLQGFLGYAQGETNIWYFGYYAGLDFNSGSPVPIANFEFQTNEGCATMANASGQLLFFTDGIRVWNKNHQIMSNGTGLLGHPSSTQSALIVPLPGTTNIYYIFTVATLSEPDGIRYSIVDMNLDGGLGAVTTTKNVLLLTPSCEKLTGIKKSNSEYLILVHGFGNNNFYCYSLTASGLNLTPVISSAGSTVTSITDTTGYMKFSPDGTKVIASNLENNVELFDFDIATGIVSNPIVLLTNYGNYAVEFSPSGDYAYITSWHDLFQFDLTAVDIPSTRVTLYTVGLELGALQLAVDGKIYLSEFNKEYLSVINDPDMPGTSCNFVEDQVYLVSPSTLSVSHCEIGLPQFVQSYFFATFKAENLCFGSVTNFTLNTTLSPTSVLWDFGNGVTSTDVNPNYQYPVAGTYNVTVTVVLPGETRTKSKQITISEVPIIANSINNQSLCSTSSSMSYNLAQHNATILGTQSANTFGIKYFATPSDASNDTNALNTNTNLSLGSTIIFAKIFNKINKKCNNSTSFTITLSQKPIANTTTDYIICENLPHNNVEIFDLSAKNSQILGSQSATDYTISYHNSQNNANDDLSPLPILYTNIAPSETLFVRIENNLDPTCYATTTLKVKVIQQPLISTITDYKVCDTGVFDDIANFDLSQKTNEILNGQSAAIFEVKYYFNNQDAQDATDAITTPINNSNNNQTIFYSITAIGNANCKAIASFKLIVTRVPIANVPPKLFVCDDVSNDGFAIFDLTAQSSFVLGTQNQLEYNISYHLNQTEATANTTSLPLNYQNITNPQTIFARIESKENPNCFATTFFQIGVYKFPKANAINNSFTCDDSSNDGKEQFDLAIKTPMLLGTQIATDFNCTYHLSQMEANSGTNTLPNSYVTIASDQIIYARIENKLATNCFDTTNFRLYTKPKPELNLKDVYSICEGTSIPVSAPLGYSSYLWSNGAITPDTMLSTDGTYSITVTKNYGDIICDVTKNIVLYNSNKATITSITTQDWTNNENTITISVTGDGDYEYSLDGVNYQTSNQFTGLTGGQYMVYVNDKKGCGEVTDEVFLLMHPNFFTPNGDGFNDYWKIEFSEIEPNLEIKIFDRYGKFLKQLANASSWDGTFNNQILPAEDYWFVIKRQNGKEYKGHFSLKR